MKTLNTTVSLDFPYLNYSPSKVRSCPFPLFSPFLSSAFFSSFFFFYFREMDLAKAKRLPFQRPIAGLVFQAFNLANACRFFSRFFSSVLWFKTRYSDFRGFLKPWFDWKFRADSNGTRYYSSAPILIQMMGPCFILTHPHIFLRLLNVTLHLAKYFSPDEKEKKEKKKKKKYNAKNLCTAIICC